jgi:hypothetical protein
MHFANIMPPYDPSQNVTNDTVSRDMEMNLPLFSNYCLATSVPYPSGAFAFNPASALNMKQASYCLLNLGHSISDAAYPNGQWLPTVKDAQNVFNPMVKSISTSATQSNLIYNNISYVGCDWPTNFKTGADDLMGAIQARQTDPPQPLEPEV